MKKILILSGAFCVLVIIGNMCFGSQAYHQVIRQIESMKDPERTEIRADMEIYDGLIRFGAYLIDPNTSETIADLVNSSNWGGTIRSNMLISSHSNEDYLEGESNLVYVCESIDGIIREYRVGKVVVNANDPEIRSLYLYYDQGYKFVGK